MFSRRNPELAPVYQDKNDKCPICRTERYMNTSMRLLVGPCFHTMCDACIDRLFAQGPAPCPVCHQILRKMAFAEPTFEDLGVEKEVRIRKRLAETFNKRPEDFESLRTYNDYLEFVEELTFNMINEVDIEATEARIKEFQTANQDVILANHAKARREEKAFDHMVEEQRLERVRQRDELQREMSEAELARKREKEEILKALATSEEPAADVLAKRTAMSLKRSSMRKQAEASQPLPSLEALPSKGTPAHHLDYAMTINRLASVDTTPFELLDGIYADPMTVALLPNCIDPSTQAHASNTAVQAGGWSVAPLHRRALEEAMSTLFLPPPTKSPLLA